MTATAALAAQDIDRHDVAFSSQGVILRGTVFLPKNVPELAAVVLLVHGAGQEHRNPGFARAFAEIGEALASVCLSFT